MAQEQNPTPGSNSAPASTPANQPAQQIDVDAITQAAVKAATEAATAAVTEAVKPITEQVQTLQQAQKNAPTAESINKAVTDAITAQSATQTKQAERQKFLAEKLKDVPEAYHGLIGDDPAKFAEQEQQVRTQLKTDLEKLGVKAENVGSTPAGEANKVTQAVDTSKLSGIELLEMGVQQTSGKATPASNATTTAGSNAPASNADAGAGGDAASK